MIHLRAICKKNVKEGSNYFPFNLNLIKILKEINLHRPVTFFVGENGSAKSTLLEVPIIASELLLIASSVGDSAN